MEKEGLLFMSLKCLQEQPLMDSINKLDFNIYSSCSYEAVKYRNWLLEFETLVKDGNSELLINAKNI